MYFYIILKTYLFLLSSVSSTTCPQCRDYNPTSHKIYLNFDEETQDLSSVTDLRTKIDMLSKDLEAQKLDSQGKLTELLKRDRNLTAENQTLKNSLKATTEKLEIESTKLKATSEENSQLKLNMESMEAGTFETILSDKIKMLEQKCNHISSEFQKEISNSTQLSIDNMKLKSYVDQMKLNDNMIVKSTKAMPDKPPKAKQQQKAIKRNIVTPKLGVVIQNIPINQLDKPLEKVVVSIGAAMELLICKDDIKRVVLKQGIRPYQKFGCVKLYVEFLTEDWKQKFISNKERLKSNRATQFVEVYEFVDETIRSLFTYANRKLRGKVFGYIAIKSNSVVAKRNLQDIDEIKITNQAQVDDLAQQQTLA